MALALLEGNKQVHMTPVILDSWFMKEKLLFHIQHVEFYFNQNAKKIHSEARVLLKRRCRSGLWSEDLLHWVFSIFLHDFYLKHHLIFFFSSQDWSQMTAGICSSPHDPQWDEARVENECIYVCLCITPIISSPHLSGRLISSTWHNVSGQWVFLGTTTSGKCETITGRVTLSSFY